MPRRHLIIRLAAIGDVAMASALARRIRAEEPGAAVHWMTGTRSAPLARLFPEVERVLEVDDAALLGGRGVARLRAAAAAWRAAHAGRYDRIYLAHPDPRYGILVAGVPGARVERASRALGRMNPKPGRYLGDEFARLYDGARDEGPVEGHWPLSDPRAGLADSGAEPCVVLVPGGARNVLREDALRRWPVEQYAALARALCGRGLPVAIVGDAGDAWVRPSFAGIGVRDLVGRASLPETIALMTRALAVVTHDTGPLHLARLARAPLVALFGPTRPAERLVPDERTVVLWGGEALACRPCYDGREFAACRANVCISRVPVGAVLDALDRVLAPVSG